MLENGEREILIRIDERVKVLHERLPPIEETQKEHAARINKAEGAAKAIRWIIGGIGALIIAIGSVLLAHVLGGK